MKRISATKIHAEILEHLIKANDSMIAALDVLNQRVEKLEYHDKKSDQRIRAGLVDWLSRGRLN